jgi:hypothetical protein
MHGKSPLMVNHTLRVLLMAGVLLASAQANAQDQSASSPGQPESAQQAASSMTGEQQSAAKTAFCSALAGQYKNAAATAASALTDPKVLLTAATDYSSAMHISVDSATSLLKEFAQQHASDILSSCAVSNASGAASSMLPGAVSSAVPGVGGIPQMPSTH